MDTRTSAQKAAIIQHAQAHVKHLVAADATGHDWHHIERVRQIALRLAQAEGLDPFLPELIAILHETTDRKIVGSGQEDQAAEKLKEWLGQHGLAEPEITEILYVITNQSYSASGISGLKLSSPVGQIVQDADRLDALGAIGIARCFAYNGKRGNPIHDPAQPPRTASITAAEYKQDRDTSINHFYEKLLELKDLMNTTTARQIASARHEFMEKFLEEFYAEWNGTK